MQKINDLLGTKKQDLDIFGLKGQAKELEELKNKYVSFYTELEKLRKKALSDKKAPKGTIGAIDNAVKIGQDLENKEKELIVKKWNETYSTLLQEGYDKANAVSENARQKELTAWQKYTDDLKVKLLETGKGFEEVNSVISDLFSKGNQNLKAKFAIEDLGEIDKEVQR